MKHLILCPSNQDRNVGAYPSGASEYNVMHSIAQKVKGDDDMTVNVILAAPESQDTYRLEGLISQLERARALADALPGECIIVSLHSDSGTASHVFGCYDGGMAPTAMAVAAPVAAVFGVSARPVQLSGYLFHAKRGRHLACLIECGSHQNMHDIAILLGQQDAVAAAVAEGARAAFGLSLPSLRAAGDGGDATYFMLHGKPYNPNAAIAKYWRALRALGVNLGPAVTDEIRDFQGEPIIQFFESAAIVCHPDEDYACYLWQTFTHLSPFGQ